MIQNFFWNSPRILSLILFKRYTLSSFNCPIFTLSDLSHNHNFGIIYITLIINSVVLHLIFIILCQLLNVFLCKYIFINIINCFCFWYIITVFVKSYSFYFISFFLSFYFIRIFYLIRNFSPRLIIFTLNLIVLLILPV